MSRLSGIGGRIGGGGLRIPSSLSITVIASAGFLLLILVILAGGAYYAFKSSSVPPAVLEEPSTTTAPPTTTTLAPPTTSSTSSTTTTSSTTSTTQETTSTTTTLSKTAIAFCMQAKISDIYVGANPQSKSLATYLGPYPEAFPMTDCTNEDYKEECASELRGRIDSEELYYDGKLSKSIGYPAVILSRDNAAYIIRSTSEFESLLECGSLKQL